MLSFLLLMLHWKLMNSQRRLLILKRVSQFLKASSVICSMF